MGKICFDCFGLRMSISAKFCFSLFCLMDSWNLKILLLMRFSKYPLLCSNIPMTWYFHSVTFNFFALYCIDTEK